MRHVAQRFGVDREETAGGTVFRRHVRDRGAVGEGHVVEAGAVELDEFGDDALFAQHLDDGENEVCRGDAFLELAGQFEADDFRHQHRLRLAEHGGFSFDAADAPAEDGEAVDHGRVAVSADDGVGVGEIFGAVFVGPDDVREVLEVDLVADAGAGRDDAEVVERALAPFQEVVAFDVAFVFEFDVVGEGLGVPNASMMTEWSMTRSTGTSGLILRGSPPRLFMPSRMAARSTTAGTPVKSCMRTRAGRKPISTPALPRCSGPLGSGDDVFLLDRAAVFMAQQVLEQYFQGIGQVGNVAEAILCRVGQRVIGVGFATSSDGFFGFEAVEGCRCLRAHVWRPSGWTLFTQPRRRCAGELVRALVAGVPFARSVCVRAVTLQPERRTALQGNLLRSAVIALYSR